jgi:hypothetical protein
MIPKTLIAPGAVLASVAVVTATLPYLEDTVSPCFDHRTTAMICTAVTPEMADHPDGGEPEPLQAQRAPIVTASSTVVQLEARSMVMAAGRGALTLSSA